jgi:hypothetical protein
MKSLIEKLSITAILFGVFGLCQPWAMPLYKVSFLILLAGLVTFIVVTHM